MNLNKNIGIIFLILLYVIFPVHGNSQEKESMKKEHKMGEIKQGENKDKDKDDEMKRYVYSVKYVCGKNGNGLNSTTSTVAAGNYQTDINIQRANNAFSSDISIVPRDANSIFSETPTPAGTPHHTTLQGSQAVYVSCFQIGSLLDGGNTLKFRVGFLQIFSPEPLSVVAVYTTKQCRTTRSSELLGNVVCDGETSLDVERYDPVLVETHSDDDEPPI